jgi:hypothetical protein
MAKPLQKHVIARALEIISDESKWTRGAMARTADGSPCGCLDPAVARFCAVGALHRAAAELLGAHVFERVVEAEEFVLAANKSSFGLPSINDVEGREAVIAMFKVALAS